MSGSRLLRFIVNGVANAAPDASAQDITAALTSFLNFMMKLLKMKTGGIEVFTQSSLRARSEKPKRINAEPEKRGFHRRSL